MSLGSCLVANEPAGIGDAMIQARIEGKSWADIAKEFDLPNPGAARKAFTKYTGLTDYKVKGEAMKDLVGQMVKSMETGDAVVAKGIKAVDDALSAKPAFTVIKTDPMPSAVKLGTDEYEVLLNSMTITEETADQIWALYSSGKTKFYIQYEWPMNSELGLSKDEITKLLDFYIKKNGIGAGVNPTAKVVTAIKDNLEDTLGITKEQLIDVVHKYEAGQGYTAITQSTGLTFDQVDQVVWNHLLKKNSGYTWKAYLEKPTSKAGFDAVKEKIFEARSKGLTVEQILGKPGAPPEGVIHAVLNGTWDYPKYAGGAAIIPPPPPPPPQIFGGAVPSATGTNFERKTNTEMLQWMSSLGQDLDSSGVAAVKAYTGSNYYDINGFLRGTTRPSSTTKVNEWIRGLDASMRDVPFDMTVTRNISGLDAFGGVPPDQLAGTVFSDKGYLSTTVKESGVFNGDVQLIINVPKGSKARYVNNISVHKSEEELLLARDTKIVITRVEVTQSSYGYKRYIVYGDVLV